MIVYFADRQLNILGQASTELPKGMKVIEDLQTEDVETGVAIFECKVPFDKKTRSMVEACTEVGNYVLLFDDSENKLFTIIDSEKDTKSKEVYIYAEDGGMDLLNEIFGAYEADKEYPIAHYVNKYAAGAGFQIGINEAASLARKLSWDGESTAAERIASVATQFDGCEVSYSFDVEGLAVTKKYINIYKERGKDIGVTLRLNKEVDRIVTTKSIANLATALQCTGGTPENEEEPITLDGYKYDDGDFYVDGGILKSREALKRWNRYLWKNEQSEQIGGHIVKPFSYDTTSQSTLCAHAITELKKIRDIAVNYEADINRLPDNTKVGDRVDIVDDEGELYLSTRILKLEKSRADQTCKATFGEFLIKSSGISQKVADLAAQFAASSQSALRASVLANNALEQALSAKQDAEQALQEIEEILNNLQGDAGNAVALASDSAEEAHEAAAEARATVDELNLLIASLQTTINNAQLAADNAQLAATTADEKADEAKAAAAQAAANDADAKADQAAADLETAKQNLANVTSRVGATEEEIEAAQAAVATAQTAADRAQEEAEAAQATANTAKANAATAQTAANTAKTAADNAQAAADEAQQAADEAQAAVNALTVRVTSAETKITQNTEQIALMAKKTEVTQTLGGYLTKEETEAAIKLESDSITSEISSTYATSERVTSTESLIQQLSNCIAMLVTDENGESLMTQTDDGWTFSMKETSEAVSSLTDLLETLEQETGSTKAAVEVLTQAISDHGETLEYVTVTTYEDEPCIELGESDSNFKLMITNTRIMFMNGGNVPTYINTNGLVTQNIEVEGEIVQGGFVMLNTSDGGWGLLWKGVSS